jgi:hypothetical protein
VAAETEGTRPISHILEPYAIHTSKYSQSTFVDTKSATMGLYPTLLNSTTETRILTLTQIDPFQGRLEIASLNDVQLATYTALSYTWKNPMIVAKEEPVQRRPSMPNTIEINEYCLPITRNLSNALRYLFERNERQLWVDAICINQQDDVERGNQVGLMGRIYSSAKKVVVWLGHHADNSELAMDFLAFLAAGSGETNRLTWLSGLCEPEYSGHWNSVYTLLHRNWWKRAWVIQEAVLAREIEMACGDRVLSEIQLVELQELFTRFWFHMFPSPTIRRIGMTSRDLERLLGPLRMRLYIRQGRRLGCLPSLFLTKDTIASDSRDLLFAKYGLIGAKAVQLYSPDYTTSAEKVCTEFAWAYIQQEQDLTILCYAGIPLNKRRPNFPTWLPDWGPSKPSYALKCSWSNNVTDWPHWKASGDTLPSVQLSSDGRILEAEGAFVDAVDGVQFDPWCKRDFESQEGAQSKSRTVAFNTRAEAFEALYRTVVADTHRREPPLEPVQAEAAFGQLFAKACYDCDLRLEELQERPGFIPTAPREGASNIEKRWHGMRHLELGGCTLRELVHDAYQTYQGRGHELDGPLSDSPEWLGWEHSFGQAMYHRRLFTTVRGYIGIGSRTLSASDRVCILKGCALPLIVRSSEGQEHVQVVGECYIQGYMDGEISQNIGVDGLRWEKICFR